MARCVVAILVSAAAMATPTTLRGQEEAAAHYRAVLGEWEMTMETPRGSMTQQFMFRLDGDVLKGTASTRRGTSDLQNVAFSDGQLTFDLVRAFGDRSFKQSFTAKVSAGTMEGTVSGGRGGERPFAAKRKAT